MKGRNSSFDPYRVQDLDDLIVGIEGPDQAAAKDSPVLEQLAVPAEHDPEFVLRALREFAVRAIARERGVEAEQPQPPRECAEVRVGEKSRLAVARIRRRARRIDIDGFASGEQPAGLRRFSVDLDLAELGVRNVQSLDRVLDRGAPRDAHLDRLHAQFAAQQIDEFAVKADPCGGRVLAALTAAVASHTSRRTPARARAPRVARAAGPWSR